jgi:hypothetical protein
MRLENAVKLAAPEFSTVPSIMPQRLVGVQFARHETDGNIAAIALKSSAGAETAYVVTRAELEELARTLKGFAMQIGGTNESIAPPIEQDTFYFR